MAGPLITRTTSSERLGAVLLAATAAFVVLTAYLHVFDHVPWIDRIVFDWASGHQSEGLNAFLKFFARLGAVEIVLPVGFAFAAVTGIKLRSLSPFGILGAAYGVAAVTTLRVKHLLERPEPFDRPGDLGLSYPSGHMSQSVAVYLVLWVLADAWSRRAEIRTVLGVVEAIVVTAILYRSAHFLLDVVGGALLGVAGACVGLLAMRLVEWLPGTRDLLALLRSRPITQPDGVSPAPPPSSRSGGPRTPSPTPTR